MMPSATERAETVPPKAGNAPGSSVGSPAKFLPTPSFAGQHDSMRAADREFLPAAIEILESPPSPAAIFFVWLLFTMIATSLVWSYFGRLDIFAVASGKVQPSGQSKVVQPLDTGKAVAVFVVNGQRVLEGAPLLNLDATETAAESQGLAQDLDAAAAEASRRRAAVIAARLDQPVSVPIEFEMQISESLRARETGVLAADISQLAAALQSLRGQLDQNRATIDRLTDSIAQREKLLSLDKELIEMRETLSQRGVGSRALVIDAQQKYETEVTSQTGERGQLREAAAAVNATEQKMTETSAQFVADQTQKLAEAERKRDRLVQDLIKARTKHERMRLKAPISGTVQQLAVTTIGQVVMSGQALMTIVPFDAPLEIEAMVLNKDIGFTRPGQQATIKVEAFPFTRYGTLTGTVIRVSADAVDLRSAPNLSEASSTVRQQGAAPSTGVSNGSGPDLAFPATIGLARRTIVVDGQEVDLSPGMAVTVEIKTGNRRIIDYVLSPLREAISGAAHER